MPDELDNKPLGYWDDYFRPAGFTLADVRRLAIALRDYDDHSYLHEELAPFAHLLKEKSDAQG